MKGQPVYRDEHVLIVRNPDDSYEGIAWNICQNEREDAKISISLPSGGKQCLKMEIVDETTCNPLKHWHMMGEPSSLKEDELRFLRQSAMPLCKTEIVSDGRFEMTLAENAVVHFASSPVKDTSDYGYEYDWYNNNR